ncbi:MAG: glycosyltransferase [Bacteroidaceae bacterium]|nr:glycosyltransferase [Bacteroidaceae bacterium]
MKKVIFVGWVNLGKAPVDGETTKNQYIIAELKKYCQLTVLDFYEKRRHPWVYLQALWALLSKPKATIIFSTSAKNVYAILRLFMRLHVRRDIIYWVIGGAFAKQVRDGIFRADVFNHIKYNLVQCHSMINVLNEAGVTNARFVSNFKPIPYYPDMKKALATRAKSDTLRFVFLSRIMPDKGCDYILQAIRRLNAKGLQTRFSIDFYGKIDAGYREQFLKEIGLLENASWHGLLNLHTTGGYDTLAAYHAMLFPTYHPTEGFAGVFIDAFIAALPVLASHWAYNAEAITDGKQGIIYPVHNVEALTNVMENCITGQVDLQVMARNARAEASAYEAKKVLTEAYLKSIGLIDEKHVL